MSRSGYNEDGDSEWGVNPWPAIVRRAVQGKPGVTFLTEMVRELDAMPVKELIAEELIVAEGSVCALGCVGKARGIDMTGVDPEDYQRVAKLFGITETMAREVVFQNDDDFSYSRKETPAQRWARVRKWAAEQISEADRTERQKRELKEAGWTKAGRNTWLSPDGKKYCGSRYAHSVMTRAKATV